ncbi:hypothetical protein LCGC14_2903060, partial [marine sediment metagenome]
DVARMMAGMSIREGARLLNVKPTRLWRFLRTNGYQPVQTTTWRRS